MNKAIKGYLITGCFGLYFQRNTLLIFNSWCDRLGVSDMGELQVKKVLNIK